jgi:hypothetical protein
MKLTRLIWRGTVTDSRVDIMFKHHLMSLNMNSKHFESSTYECLSAYRPRMLHSPLTDFTVLVFCVRITLEYCVHLVESYLYCIASNHQSNVYFQATEGSVVSLCQASTLPCRVWCSLCTLYYHIKPQPHHVKLQSGWVKHYSYHGKFSQRLRSFALV